MISLCMIVKDEEEAIARCLSGAADFVDEIIVVDTGSKDATKQIALAHHAIVEDFCWCDDFSAARNYGLSKAHGDWILWLDADEELVVNDTAFFQMINSSKFDVFSIEMTHYYGEQPFEEQRSYHSSAYRIFRKETNLCFKGRIHENLDLTEKDVRLSDIPAAGINIKHYGYTNSAVKNKNKSERNLTLLLRECEKDSSPWIHYHIAAERYRLLAYKQALSDVNLSIQKFLELGTLPPAMIYKLKYDILLSTGTWEHTLSGLELATKLYPDYVDLVFYKGLALMQEKRYKEATLSFLQCLKLGDHHPFYLVLTGTGSYFALYYLGECYQKLGYEKEAYAAYQKAFVLYPEFEQIRIKLNNASADLLSKGDEL